MDVELPDGTIVEDVPEGTTKSQLMDRIMKAQAKGMDVGPKNEQDASRWAPPSLPMRALKQGAHGLIEGTYGAAREMAGLAPFGPVGPIPPFLMPKGVGEAIKERIPNTSEVNNMLAKLGMDISVPPPANKAEEFIDPMARFGGGMLPGPAAKAGSMAGPIERWLAPLVKRAVVGAGIGGTGQVAREVSGENQASKYVPRPDIAGTTAEILAGILPALAMHRTPNTTRVLNPMLENTSEETIRAAREKADRTAAFLGPGTKVMLSQGMEEAGPLAGLNQAMVQSPGGLQAQSIFAQQLAAAMGKARGFAESPSSLATGFAEENRVMQAGKEAIGAPAKARSLATRPLYDLAKKEPFDLKEIKYILDDLETGRINETMLESSTAGKALLGHMKKLRAAREEGTGIPPTFQLTHGLSGSYPVMTSPGQPGREITSSDIGRLSKEAKTKQESLYAAGKDKSAAKAHEMAGEILDARLQNYPAWQTAQDEFTRLSAPVQAMKVSPMQEAFPRAARTTGRGDWTAGERFLLDQRHEADSVREVARILKTQDPEAFPLMVKKTWTDMLDTASSKVGGINPDLAPGTFANVIAGSKGSKAREKFLATVGELGMDQRTAERMVEAFETISTGREGVGGVNQAWLQHAAGSNPISMVAQTPGVITGGSPAANAMRRVVEKKTMERIVELFTDPKWIDEVVRISKYSPTMRGFQTALVGAMGLAGAHLGGPTQPKPEEIAGQLFQQPKN